MLYVLNCMRVQLPLASLTIYIYIYIYISQFVQYVLERRGFLSR